MKLRSDRSLEIFVFGLRFWLECVCYNISSLSSLSQILNLVDHVHNRDSFRENDADLVILLSSLVYYNC